MECTFYPLTVWPATKAGPEETATKKRTSKLPVKTINSLYFVCQFPVGSMSHPSPWYSSPLLFKSLSFTPSKQLHPVKNCGKRLEWSKSQLVRAVPLMYFFLLYKFLTVKEMYPPSLCRAPLLVGFLIVSMTENSVALQREFHFHLQPKMFSLWQETCTHCAWGHAQVLPLTGYLVKTKISSSNYIWAKWKGEHYEGSSWMFQRPALALQCWCDTRS